MGYGFMDLAYDVLQQATKPLTYQEIWEQGSAAGLSAKVPTAGKTPWQSLGAQLYISVRDDEKSRFIKVGKRPARFFLKERQSELPPDAANKFDREDVKKVEKKLEFRERD